MGLWLGFQSPSPLDKANSAGPGEAGWSIRLLPRPTEDNGLRAVVSTPTAHATFESPDDAMQYVNHPGSLPILAGFYLGYCAALNVKGN